MLRGLVHPALELAGLEWGHIDFNGKFIQVSQQFVRGRLKTLKTKKSRRRVDLSDELMETLKAHRRKLREIWLAKGSNEIPKWAFPNELAEPINMNIKVRHHFEKCLSKAGLRHLRLHDPRHTYATLLLMQNESLVYVKEQLGHSSITMTVDALDSGFESASSEPAARA